MTEVAETSRRCAQCWKDRPIGHFQGARGGLVRRCKACRKNYDKWDKADDEGEARR